MLSKKQKLITNSSHKKQNKNNNIKIKNNIKTKKNKNNIKKTKKNQKGGVLQYVQFPSSHYIYLKNSITGPGGTGDTPFRGFSPFKLNCALLQYIINEKKLNIQKVSGTDTNQYIGFTDFPSLIETTEYSKKDTKAVKKDTERDFVEIIEGNVKIISRETNYRNLMDPDSHFDIDLEIVNYDDSKPKEIRKIRKITQDVKYLKKLIEDLSNILKSKATINRNNTTNETFKPYKPPEICDLSYSTNDFLIIDEKKYEGIDERVIIVGYPSEINPFLKLKIKNPTNPEEEIYLIDYLMETIFKEHKKPETEVGNYCELILKLFNAFKKDKVENNIDLLKNSFLDNLELIEAFIANNPTLFPGETGTKKIKEIEEQVEVYLQKKIKGFLTRPNTKIRYVFHIFIQKRDGQIEPLIYNIRELEQKHKAVLERLLYLIQTEIPRRFQIFNEDELTRIAAGEDVRYTNFYSYYRYGDIFYIKTEYLYPSTNLDQYNHVYNRSLNLEEIIYSSGLLTTDGSPYWSKIKFKYELRQYRLKPLVSLELQSHKKSYSSSQKKSYSSSYQKSYSPSHTQELPALIPTEHNLENSKILLLREHPNSVYELYYQASDGTFHYIKIKPVLDLLNFESTNITLSQNVFDCFGLKTNIYITNQPVFQIETSYTISSSLQSDKINLFDQKWSFPVVRTVLNDEKCFENIPTLRDFENFYPYSPYNVLMSVLPKNIKKPLNTNNILKKGVVNPVKITPGCEVKICDSEEFNYSITFTIKNENNTIEEIILVINKHTARIKTKEEPIERLVVWVFPKPKSTPNIVTERRFKTIKDISLHLFEEILRQLSFHKFYDEKKQILGFNNYLAYNMKNFHFQIFKKEDRSYYESFIETNSFIALEKRMENGINGLYKMQTVPNYYNNYDFVIFSSLRINGLT